MAITEEIEQLKAKLDQTTTERGAAEVLQQLLVKSSIINGDKAQAYTDRLLRLAEKLNEPLYKAWALLSLAGLKRLAGEYEVAMDLSAQALEFFVQINEKTGLAGAYNNIGLVYFHQSNFPEALKNHFITLKLREGIGDKGGIATTYNNIAAVYDYQGNYLEALKSHYYALKLREEIGDRHGVSNSYNNVGAVYLRLGNYPEALKSLYVALKICEESGDKRGIGSAYNNIGNAYQAQANYPEALKNYFAAEKPKEETGDKWGIANLYNNIGNVYELQGKYPEALENYLVAMKLKKQLGDKHGIANLYLNIGCVYELLGNYPMALNENLMGLRLSEEIGAKELIQKCSFSLANTHKLAKDYKNALKYYEQYHQTDNEIRGMEAAKQYNDLIFMHQLEQKEKDLEIEQLRNVDLKREKERSESLLLNILPPEVAEELRTKGKADAKLYRDVTVLYTDFVDFTGYGARVSPEALVAELANCFNAFDDIIAAHHVEKIKTIGDAYMAVAGLPLANASHAENAILAAVEIREFMQKRRKELGANTFEIRIGMHSGPVIAGIIGAKKMAYDIWGDTVNTATRMEQNSEAGKINISEITYELVKDKFNCVYRGKIEAKNRGKLKMYFVEDSIDEKV